MTQELIRAAGAQLDAGDLSGFAASFLAQGALTLGATATARGPEAIEAALRAMLTNTQSIAHTILGLWPIEGGFAMQADVTHTLSGGAAVVIPTAIFWRTHQDRLAEVRVYHDLAPVNRAVEAQARPFEVRTIAVHREPEQQQKGRFVLTVDGEAFGQMTYSRAGERLIIVDHTHVDPAMEGRGLASKLAKAAIAWARETQAQVIPLCPYLSGYLKRHPEDHDIIAPGHTL